MMQEWFRQAKLGIFIHWNSGYSLDLGGRYWNTSFCYRAEGGAGR